MKEIYCGHYDSTQLAINRGCKLKPNSMCSYIFDKMFKSGVSDNRGLTGVFYGVTYSNFDVVGYHIVV